MGVNDKKLFYGGILLGTILGLFANIFIGSLYRIMEEVFPKEYLMVIDAILVLSIGFMLIFNIKQFLSEMSKPG